jgi:hypothetical protein
MVFGSLFKQLDSLKKQIENEWKLNKTDYEAFKQKYEKLAIPLVPILQIVSVGRSTDIPSIN